MVFSTPIQMKSEDIIKYTNQLQEPYRSILNFYYRNGYTQKQIAVEMNVSLYQVKVKLSKGLYMVKIAAKDSELNRARKMLYKE